ncbi:DUF2510 domain-containing protein [Microbacterium sp. 179-I 3D3 NHS]|uniref:DUF2510 domain-containing protein n=1 Tax=Microbacterium sp. 179-I 3D3 NHS TaxID=3142382 RepID=UPI0039A1362E
MSTPAGWYDDGSGRQRWWDGQQWTEHFAPEAPAAPQNDTTPLGENEAPTTSLDDTVIRPETPDPSPTDSGDAPAAAGEDAAPAFAVAPPAAPQPAASDHPVAPPAPDYPVAPATPDAYPGVSGGYPPAAGGYGATPAYPGAAGASTPDEPKKVSVLGIVGLGLAVLGTILVFIPVIGFLGFFLLAAAFIVSLISLFLKGKKWPGITGLALSIVGTILGVVMGFVYLAMFAAGVNEELGDLPTSAPSISAEPLETGEPDAGASTDRPTVEELEVGIAAIIQSTGTEGYTPESITCFAEEFYASDIDDETLRVIASGDDATFSDAEAALAFTDQFTDSLSTCLIP